MIPERYISSSVRTSKAASARTRAAELATAFKIEVRFQGGLSATHKSAFKKAADRWTRIIIGDLPSVVVDGEEIDDLLIIAEGRELDGPQGVLGQSGPTALRPKAAGPHAYLPAKGEMSFDVNDLRQMQKDGTLADVIAHEMGHVLGIGTIWARKRLLVGARSDDPTYKGKQARAEYGKLLGIQPQNVPVENLGDKGTRNSHWRESVFGNELMSGFIADKRNPLSALTIASLADLGYEVDYSRAEEYQLPEHAAAMVRASVARNLRPTLPVVLPDSALV